MYAWESSFNEQVKDIREKELGKMRSQAYISGGVSVMGFCAPYLVALAIFGTYVLSSPDNVLDPEKAFVSLSIIVILNAATSYVPMFVTFVAQVCNCSML